MPAPVLLSQFPPLNEAAIRAQLSSSSAQGLKKLSVLSEVSSTNAWLLQLSSDEFHAHAVFAEEQTAGRGRRGKAWQSPPGSNIYLSLGWIFGAPVRDMPCLSLAVGVAVVRALESQGISTVGLKWPNDIQANGRKLGGILLESRPAGGGRSAVVIGIGINVAMPTDEAAARAIDQPWTSVTELNSQEPDPDLRDRLAGALLEQLLGLPDSFEADGFESFRADWKRLDVLLGQEVAVVSAEGGIKGRVQGVDRQGNLQVTALSAAGEPQQHCFSSAEVSVRQAVPASHK